MYVPPEWKKRLWIAAGVAVLVLPGWAGTLVPVPHEDILLESARYDAGEVFGVSRGGDAEGEEWNVQYMANDLAQVFHALNLPGLLTRLVPPSYAAHIPPRSDFVAERADGYFRVETRSHWPWWWPGGGVDWHVPR